MRYLFLLMIISFFVSCIQKKSTGSNTQLLNHSRNQYSNGFEITDTLDQRTIRVFNPWQRSNNIVLTYTLSDFQNNSSKNCIKTPVKRVVCLSTTHIAMLSALGESDKIIAISGARLVTNSTVRSKIEKKEIVDIGYEQNLNFELIASLKPDVIFAYGVSADITNYVYKLSELGLTVVLVAEYLEASPLAKAEWLKFFGEFFDKREQAASLFDTIQKKYTYISGIALKTINKPYVMSGMPWSGSWYVSGNKSYQAKLIDDAGGNYIWNDLDSRESVPIDLERIFIKIKDVDYWINLSTAHSKADILAADERFATVKAFQNGNLFNNNARENPNGGNDYWEFGTCRPDIILSDLVKIFHQELLPDKKLYYYRKIN